jgi:hypothetical protein
MRPRLGTIKPKAPGTLHAASPKPRKAGQSSNRTASDKPSGSDYNQNMKNEQHELIQSQQEKIF